MRPYHTPAMVLSVRFEELTAQVHGFFSDAIHGGCAHPDFDGDCDSATGESHENGHGT